MYLPDRDSTGSGYHQELARELSDFLVPVLERQGGMKSLADVYCLFNRARGVGKYPSICIPYGLHLTINCSVDIARRLVQG
jgi:hypothetical protein